MKRLVFLSLTPCLLFFVSCSRGFEPIEYGKDPCAHCKMTIVDDRFAAEMVTKKGRAFKFDDILCMKQFLNEQKPEGGELFFVSHFLKTETEPLDATKAVYLKNDFFKSPMNGNYGAFKNETEAQSLKDSLGIFSQTWENIQ